MVHSHIVPHRFNLHMHRLPVAEAFNTDHSEVCVNVLPRETQVEVMQPRTSPRRPTDLPLGKAM